MLRHSAAGIGAGGGAPLRHDISGSEGGHRSVQALCHPHQSGGEILKNKLHLMENCEHAMKA